MEISAELVRELREKTKAGVMECKRALIEAESNLEKAAELLKQQGITTAEKKATRSATKGIVEAYIHLGGRIGAMVEVNCETDFVARTNEFKELAHNLALQVAAMAPQFLSREEIPQGEELDPKIVSLLDQSFIKDEKRTVQNMITESIAKLGENIKVRRFVRFELNS